jgi:hypothetical protein
MRATEKMRGDSESDAGISKRYRVSMNFLNRHRRFRSSDTTERGSSLLALLIVVLILGLMAAVALGGLGYTPNSTITGVPSTMPGGGAIVATTPTAVPAKGKSTKASAMVACRADYAMVSAAVQKYKDRNGSLPQAGTAWARAPRRGGPYLRVWPRDNDRFVIVWNGATLSVIPNKGAIANDSIGTRSPATGCFAA